MSQVEFYDEVAGLASFVIEGEEYSEDGESAVVPVAVLKRTDIASISAKLPPSGISMSA